VDCVSSYTLATPCCLLYISNRSGGPTLIWSDIQSSCYDAIGDVLLILDCCHATLFTKGQKLNGRFEVLAACAKGLETPLPGEGSFTWAILRALGQMLEPGITAQELRGLIEDHTRGSFFGHIAHGFYDLISIPETPFWDSMGNRFTTSILIKRLTPSSDTRFRRKPAGYVIFRASLSGDLDGIQISDWLKTNAPPHVTAVHIEAIVLKARRLQKNLDHNAFPQDSTLRKLSQPAQLEILKRLQSLDTQIATASRNSENPLTQGDAEAIRETLSAISTRTDAARISIETPLLLDAKEEVLKKALDDDDPCFFDALENLSLHESVIEATGAANKSFEIPRNDIQFRTSDERFVKGGMGGQSVLIDFFEYTPDRDGNPFPETIEQVEKMSELLCHRKDLSFHILPGLGYVHEKVKNRVGLIFQLGPRLKDASMPPVTLQSLYATHRRMSLSRRVDMAYAIIRALESLHRVEWIHKEIRSDNICFLAVPKTELDSGANIFEIDFRSPWLFGFEYARAMAAGTKLEEDHSETRNLYRHPQRWSRPQVRFTRPHDVYSLGVVLMEIASWRQISDVVRLTGRVKADTFREKLEEKLERDLKHQVGDVLSETISACFRFEKSAEGMDNYNMQRLFQTSVLDRIQKIVGNV
jgi:hypothetical protein